MKKNPSFLFVLICCVLNVFIASATAPKPTPSTAPAAPTTQAAPTVQNDKEDCTDLARDEETLMVFSTLGGGLTAIDPLTSEIRWTIADDPPIMAEQEQNFQVPQFLPDPRDGSIYQLGDMGSFKKLPYTIPQLVASSPCRSSNGILYSGKKSDTWFMIDPKTGRREKVFGFGASMDSLENKDGEKIGWATSRAIYLGRTQYTVMMYDSLAKNKNIKPWNITFYDYNSHSMAPDITKKYEYLHLTTTANGNILTLDRQSGKFLWKKDLTSPVIAAFLLSSEGLLSVPFTTLSDEAFDSILEESKCGNVNTINLFKSLYVGEHQHGLYALPSLVDKNTPTITTSPPIKLLDGPNKPAEIDDPTMIYLNDVIPQKYMGIVIGHYDLPKDLNMEISPSAPKDNSNHGLATINNIQSSDSLNPNSGYTTLLPANENNELRIETTNTFNKTKKIIIENSDKIQQYISNWFHEHPNGITYGLIVTFLCFLVFVLILNRYYSANEWRNQSVGHSSRSSTGNKDSTGSNVSSAQDIIDLGDGLVKVGKIIFNPNEMLGKGCEGTFVFKGTFEERSVAVKRLLPGCFTLADREVTLLRESDSHENVVRYFCTEQDRQFRYIAVELCAATLQDYTEGEKCIELQAQIDMLSVLRQAAAGLNHLHSLNIVHRDIKPQNVLLSLPDNKGKVRVMISDFGLCKKLNFGKSSFSRRSGVTGTEGWIAPEMMQEQRVTTSVDIFSLGCVYYYVLSGGHHAFGDALKRQVNILSHDFTLKKLNNYAEESKIILAEQLISDMIHKDPQRRPPANVIENHPIFWNNQKVLNFLQDVSDRVEKLQLKVEPLKSLEKNGRFVVLEDWNLHLDPIITEDLRKYRGYMGASVRDLLRALRNKKHHYHELTIDVQETLGSIPNDFTNYWISKFPQLISHAYHAFSICSNETHFGPYYDKFYKFTRPEYFDADDDLFPSLLSDPKTILKQNLGNASPNKPKSPEKLRQNQQQQQQQLPPTPRNRKGAYNFRKNSNLQDLGVDNNNFGVGLQRNMDLNTNGILTETTKNDDNDENKYNRNLFSNFKTRRSYKTPNRNYNNFKSNNTNNKDKNIQWTLSNEPDNG